MLRKQILLLGKQKMFLPGVKNIFASRTQILRPKHMFPSLATPGNITRNIVSATMFPSLARAEVKLLLCWKGFAKSRHAAQWPAAHGSREARPPYMLMTAFIILDIVVCKSKRTAIARSCEVTHED